MNFLPDREVRLIMKSLCKDFLKVNLEFIHRFRIHIRVVVLFVYGRIAYLMITTFPRQRAAKDRTVS